MKTINNIPTEDLVSQLKREDMKYSRLSKSVFIIYIILIPLFTIVEILGYTETKDAGSLIWTACIVSSFSIFAFLFRSLMKEYQNVDYSKPTSLLLKGAVRRYQPFHPKSIWLLPAIILLEIGLYFLNPPKEISFLQFQLLFAVFILFAFIIGILVWFVKYKPIRDKALKLLQELDE